MQMPGDELDSQDVTSMLQHLYRVSDRERLFSPYCDVRLRIMLNLILYKKF